MKNIIFDLGGVLLNIDANITIEAFRKLGIEHFEKIFTLFTQSDVTRRYEKGLISDDEFRQNIRKHSSLIISDNEIDTAWNAMLLDFPTIRLEMLLDLRKNNKVFLLSNTNGIHYREFLKRINTQIHQLEFNALFDRAYYSFEMGMRKPDADIFEFVFKENSLSKQDTLFIDDNPENVEAARKLGINTFHVQPKQEIATVIKELIK